MGVPPMSTGSQFVAAVAVVAAQRRPPDPPRVLAWHPGVVHEGSRGPRRSRIPSGRGTSMRDVFRSLAIGPGHVPDLDYRYALNRVKRRCAPPIPMGGTPMPRFAPIPGVLSATPRWTSRRFEDLRVVSRSMRRSLRSPSILPSDRARMAGVNWLERILGGWSRISQRRHDPLIPYNPFPTLLKQGGPFRL